jgi:hypothetical protein
MKQISLAQQIRKKNKEIRKEHIPYKALQQMQDEFVSNYKQSVEKIFLNNLLKILKG